MTKSWEKHGVLGSKGQLVEAFGDGVVAPTAKEVDGVEMMGFLGIGNNPMVGATVSIAVEVSLALNGK